MTEMRLLLCIKAAAGRQRDLKQKDVQVPGAPRDALQGKG